MGVHDSPPKFAVWGPAPLNAPARQRDWAETEPFGSLHAGQENQRRGSLNGLKMRSWSGLAHLLLYVWPFSDRFLPKLLKTMSIFEQTTLRTESGVDLPDHKLVSKYLIEIVCIPALSKITMRTAAGFCHSWPR